jgi:hypothetical protein
MIVMQDVAMWVLRCDSTIKFQAVTCSILSSSLSLMKFRLRAQDLGFRVKALDH